MKTMDDQRFWRLHTTACRVFRAQHCRRHLSQDQWMDLSQEMALALWALDRQTDSYCVTRAIGAAIDWLRRTHRTRLPEPIGSREDMIPLVDEGQCRKVWC